MRRFEPVSAVGGVLLAASLFAPWYRSAPFFIITRGADGTETKSSLAFPDRVTAWGVFTTLDVLLTVIAALAVLAPARWRALAASAAVLLVVFAMVDPPWTDTSPIYGAWLGLAGALIACAGGWLSFIDRRPNTRPAQRRREFAVLAATGGALLIGSLFVVWFDVIEGQTAPFPLHVDGAATGWQWFTVTDVLLGLAGALTLAAAASRVQVLSIGATAACALLAPWVLYRVLEQPGPLYADGFGLAMEPRIGAWLGLAGVLIAAVGGWLSVRRPARPVAAA
jgi:hypothetical protein